MERLIVLAFIAATLLRGESPTGDPAEWQKHYSAGKTLSRATGDYLGAAREFDLALAQAELLGPADPKLPLTLSNRALVDVSLGHYRDAETRYRRSIAIYEKYHPGLIVALAVVLQNYAGLKSEERQWSAVEKLYLRARDLFVTALGPDDPAVAKNEAAMGELELETHRFAEAETMFLHARAGLRDALDIASVDNNLAMVYSQTGQCERSDALFTGAIAAYERIAPKHAVLAIMLRNYAEFQAQRKNFAQSDSLYRRALELCDNSLGPESPEKGLIFLSYSRLLSKTGRHSEAKAALGRAREIVGLSLREVPAGLVDRRELELARNRQVAP